ncbi:MAG TPA: hypothetical protein VFP84_06600 [Kofleriaceae bacterium]|nr:hypothetical protein [Kofleriaceae bacterium]
MTTPDVDAAIEIGTRENREAKRRRLRPSLHFATFGRGVHGDA